MDYLIKEKDFIDYLEELSALSGNKLEIISSKTEEGNQIQSLGKIGALLRFKPINWFKLIIKIYSKYSKYSKNVL